MSTKQPTSRRVRVEANIYRRHDGHLEVGYRDSEGRQRWKVVHGGIKVARAERDSILARRGRGEKVIPSPRLNYNSAADAWWSAQAIKLKPNTQSAYRAALIHLRKEFGRVRLDDLSVSMVAAFVSAQEKAGFKGWTIRGQLVVLSRVLAFARRHMHWQGRNVALELEMGERPKSDGRDKRILSGEEVGRLLDSLDARYRCLFAFAAGTGARLSEVLGLAWEDLDLKGGTVSFRCQLARDGSRVALKTARSRRCIELAPSLVSLLRTHKLASLKSADHDLVFVSRDGTALEHRNIGGRVLARAIKRADLGAVVHHDLIVKPAPSFHSLRHSHASALIAANWDIEEVSARLGHTTAATTTRLYVHAYDTARRSDARRDRLETTYGAVLSGSAMEAPAVVLRAIGGAEAL